MLACGAVFSPVRACRAASRLLAHATQRFGAARFPLHLRCTCPTGTAPYPGDDYVIFACFFCDAQHSRARKMALTAFIWIHFRKGAAFMFSDRKRRNQS